MKKSFALTAVLALCAHAEAQTMNSGYLLDFRENETGRTSTRLPTTFRVGARYKMPFYKGLSARVIGTIVTGKHCSSGDLRLGATITPVKNISATVNYGYTSFGSTMGAALNLNLGFFNFYLGADSVITKARPSISRSIPAACPSLRA